MRKVYISFVLALCGFAAAAQDPVSDALPFVAVDFNPASVAMGSSTPATAATLPMHTAVFAGGIVYQSYMPALDGTKYMGAGFGGRFGKMGLSLQFVRGAGDEISGEKFTPSGILVNAGAGCLLTENLSLGANVKYAKEQVLSNYSNSAVAADVFAAATFGDLSFAGGVTSIGLKVESESTGSFRLPAAGVLRLLPYKKAPLSRRTLRKEAALNQSCAS